MGRIPGLVGHILGQVGHILEQVGHKFEVALHTGDLEVRSYSGVADLQPMVLHRPICAQKINLD